MVHVVDFDMQLEKLKRGAVGKYATVARSIISVTDRQTNTCLVSFSTSIFPLHSYTSFRKMA